MLLKCPECELQISDKATFCPHCGYPIQPDIKPRKPRNKNNKRKRLPNGFGQISQIKNRNLRNPYRAMVTVGKTSTGRPICKPLKPESYFPTYNDAYAALVEYNKNPYDLKPDITVKELYEKWTAEYFKNATDNYIETGNLDFKPFLPAKCRNTQEINDISTLFYTPFHLVLHYSLYQGYSPPLNPEGYRETNISKGSL